MAFSQHVSQQDRAEGCLFALSDAAWALLTLALLQFSHGTNWKKSSLGSMDPEMGFAELP